MGYLVIQHFYDFYPLLFRIGLLVPDHVWINSIIVSIEYHVVAFLLGFLLQRLFDRFRLGDVDFQVCMFAFGIMWIVTMPYFWLGLFVSLFTFTSATAIYIGGAFSRKELTVRNGLPWIALLIAPGVWWGALVQAGFLPWHVVNFL